MRGSVASSASRRARSPALRGRNPSKQNRSTGSPDNASAVRTADGPGTAVTAHPGLDRGGHQPVAGVGHRGHPRVGDQQHPLAGLQRLDQLGGPAGLVGVVVGDDPAGQLDAEVARQPAQAAGVLGRDDVGCRQLADQPRRGVGGVTDRRTRQHQHARHHGRTSPRTVAAVLLPTVDRARVRERLTPPMPTDVLWGWLGPLLITAVAGVLRFWDLGRPKAFIFDETYYAKDAWSLLHFGVEQDYIRPAHKGDPDPANAKILAGNLHGLWTGDPSYVVHPPGGKWMIAIGEQLFGFTPFGWRFVVAVTGTLAVLMVARIGRRLFRSTLLGCVAGLLLTVDGMEYVHSRTALLDPLLMFWALAAFGALVVDRDRTRARLAARLDDALGARFGPGLGLRPWRLAAGLLPRGGLRHQVERPVLRRRRSD